MRKFLLLLVTCFVLTLVAGCFDNGHSHDDGSHSHDNSQQKHDSIDQHN